ncbi:hypothetical protein ABZP36_026738 [Zizania latifolia]
MILVWYQEYRAEYITTQKRAYFDLHKNEDWLKDKYHPTNLLSVIERRKERCKVVANGFFLDLQNGTLDLGPGITAAAASKSASGSDGNSDDDGDDDKRRKHGKGSSKETDPLSGAHVSHPVSSESRRVQADIEQALALCDINRNELDVTEDCVIMFCSKVFSPKQQGWAGEWCRCLQADCKPESSGVSLLL